MGRRISDRDVVGLDEWLSVVRLGMNRQFQEELLREKEERTRYYGVLQKIRTIVGWRAAKRGNKEEGKDGRRLLEERVDSRAERLDEWADSWFNCRTNGQTDGGCLDKNTYC